MSIIFLFLFYASLETAVYHNDLCLQPEHTLCIGEGVAQSVMEGFTGSVDYIKEKI
jgi:hypothetical protein